MIQLVAVVAAVAEENVLPFPPLVFAAIAFAVFVFLGFVVWSFRDVANRHSQKTGAQAGHDTGRTTTDHD